MRRLLLAVLALGPLLPGCVRPPPSPAEALVRVARALGGDDPQAAYQLLDEPTRTQLPYKVFEERFRDTAPERRAQAAALTRRARGPLQTTAVISFSDGTQLALERAPGPLRPYLLRDLRLEGAQARSPEEALQLLVAAAEARSYAAVLRLLTPAQRQAIEAELRERVEKLRGALQRRQALDIKGDRARLQYDPRFYIDLKKERDGWRVQDLN